MCCVSFFAVNCFRFQIRWVWGQAEFQLASLRRRTVEISTCSPTPVFLWCKKKVIGLMIAALGTVKPDMYGWAVRVSRAGPREPSPWCHLVGESPL